MLVLLRSSPASPCFVLLIRLPPTPTLFPYTTLFRSALVLALAACNRGRAHSAAEHDAPPPAPDSALVARVGALESADRKSTRLNSSHLGISYAVFCLKKKKHVHDPMWINS